MASIHRSEDPCAPCSLLLVLSVGLSPGCYNTTSTFAKPDTGDCEEDEGGGGCDDPPDTDSGGTTSATELAYASTSVALGEPGAYDTTGSCHFTTVDGATTEITNEGLDHAWLVGYNNGTLISTQPTSSALMHITRDAPSSCTTPGGAVSSSHAGRHSSGGAAGDVWYMSPPDFDPLFQCAGWDITTSPYTNSSSVCGYTDPASCGGVYKAYIAADDTHQCSSFRPLRIDLRTFQVISSARSTGASDCEAGSGTFALAPAMIGDNDNDGAFHTTLVPYEMFGSGKMTRKARITSITVINQPSGSGLRLITSTAPFRYGDDGHGQRFVHSAGFTWLNETIIFGRGDLRRGPNRREACVFGFPRQGRAPLLRRRGGGAPVSGAARGRPPALVNKSARSSCRPPGRNDDRSRDDDHLADASSISTLLSGTTSLAGQTVFGDSPFAVDELAPSNLGAFVVDMTWTCSTSGTTDVTLAQGYQFRASDLGCYGAQPFTLRYIPGPPKRVTLELYGNPNMSLVEPTTTTSLGQAFAFDRGGLSIDGTFISGNSQQATVRLDSATWHGVSICTAGNYTLAAE